MVLAQNIGEYGAMAGLAAALSAGFTRAQIFFADLGPREYVVGAVAVVLLLRVTARRG